MKYIISHKQCKLLKQFTLTENGLIHISNNLIKESKLRVYLVRLIVNGMVAELKIGAYSSASALSIMRKLFPKVILTGSAIPIK
jgi:hypothetical protein